SEGADCAAETPPNISGHLDPVNLIFAGVTAGSVGDLFSHFSHHMTGWSTTTGAELRFHQDDGTMCRPSAQWANGSPVSERDHIRFRIGHAVDPNYQSYYL